MTDPDDALAALRPDPDVLFDKRVTVTPRVGSMSPRLDPAYQMELARAHSALQLDVALWLMPKVGDGRQKCVHGTIWNRPDGFHARYVVTLRHFYEARRGEWVDSGGINPASQHVNELANGEIEVIWEDHAYRFRFGTHGWLRIGGTEPARLTTDVAAVPRIRPTESTAPAGSDPRLAGAVGVQEGTY